MSPTKWRITERRKQLGMSQEELALRIGADQKQISRYERELGNPTIKTLASIAEALDTSISWILGETDDIGDRLTKTELTPREREVIMAWRYGKAIEAAQIILSDAQLASTK